MSECLPRVGEFRVQLNSLRAFAVMGVILSHTSPHYVFLQYVRPGDRGVQLFFVLSGFLISGILFNAIEARGAAALGPFFARRILRLMPLFYIVLAVTAFVDWEHVRHSILYHLFYLTNFRFIATGGWEEYTAHFWTLATEEQFYLVWPVLLIAIPARYWWLGVVILFALGLGTRLFMEITERWRDFGAGLYPTYYADNFGGGAAVALWLRSNPRIRLVRHIAYLFIFCGVAVLASIYAYLGPLRAVNSTLDVSGWMMVSVGLILTCHIGVKGHVGRWLECKPLVIIGKISYGVYLWHVLAILAAAKIFGALGLYGLLGRFGWILTFAGTTVLSFGLAAMSWYFIESKLLRYKSRFQY